MTLRSGRGLILPLYTQADIDKATSISLSNESGMSLMFTSDTTVFFYGASGKVQEGETQEKYYQIVNDDGADVVLNGLAGKGHNAPDEIWSYQYIKIIAASATTDPVEVSVKV